MSRLQLALNVDNIDDAVAFYSTLFDTAPAKRRPGYANFAVVDPPLKLVLFENPAETGTLNHLVVERESPAEVAEEGERLQGAGLSLVTEPGVECCYARQDKHWVTGPDGQRWENYVVLADVQQELEGRWDLSLSEATATGCCSDPGPGEPAATGCCT